MRIRALSGDENGAILVLSALSIVVLMVFAALTVDLGAAWSQRRQNQSAADAGVMAGALNVVSGGGTNPLVIAKVQEFVNKNLDPDVTADDWDDCTDTEVSAGNFVALDPLVTECISVSTSSPNGARILRVQIPTRNVETAFAGIIGIDTIATSAFAEAELSFGAAGGALPFIVPTGPAIEYCIGDVPGGLANDPCNGPQRGQFGDFDSPFYGRDDWGTPECPGSPGNPYPGPGIDLLEWNVALGLDHPVFAADGNDSQRDPADGEDTCDAKTDGYFPYSLKLGSGNPQPSSLTAGFSGDGPYGTTALLPGRLRRGSGPFRDVPSGNGNSVVSLDNVGLWEYLKISSSGNPDICDGDHPDYEFDGPTATGTLEDCLSGVDDADPDFTTAIGTSPRFALIPRLWLNQAQLDDAQPGSFHNIKEFIPVYIQTTFWNCSNVDCMAFRTLDDNTPDDPSDDPQFFSPGEGVEEGCLIQGNGCKNNVNLSLTGVTAWVLDGDDIPDEAFGGGSEEDEPIFVRLFR